MQIVTDSGTDVCLSPEQVAGLGIHIVPLVVTLGGRSYREGVDIRPDEFYRLLAAIVYPSHHSPRRVTLPRPTGGWRSPTLTFCLST